MKVAVTGGAGFIGSWVRLRLRELGHSVPIIDHHAFVDLFSEEAVSLIEDADAVIHLAGVLGTSELFNNPHKAVRQNIEGTLLVLRACERARTSYVGITMPDVWMNVYQATKRCAFELAEAWRLHRGVRASYVRAYNVYGVGQHYGVPRKIVPSFSVQSWRQDPIEVWGDGRQTVDLVHVADVARMLVDALAFGDGEVFDAGTGHLMDVNEVAELVNIVTGSRGGIMHLPMRPGEKPHSYVNARGAGWELLDWRPRWEEGLFHETVESYRDLALRSETYTSERSA